MATTTDRWAALAPTPDVDYDAGHIDGYLPHILYGPFSTRDDAARVGTPIGIWEPADGLSDPGGRFVVLWFGRNGTLGLIGPYNSSNAPWTSEYEDELTGTGEHPVVLTLCEPDYF